MPRYIDADDLMNRLDRKKAGPHDRKYTEGFNDALMRFRSMVSTEPTVSPDEARGVGKWYKPHGMMPPEHTGKHRCSNCNSFAMRGWKSIREELTNYCPNCGAKMEVSEDA